MQNASPHQKLSHHARQEWHLFRLALMFYTRLPVGELKHYDEILHNQSTRYFTLVGALVGGLCALVYGLCLSFFSPALAVLLSVVFGIWLTGAFHEDGLADSCDGIGGGWDSQRILDIMKDSRIGTYGMVGLVSVLAIKCLALTEIAHNTATAAGQNAFGIMAAVMICGHILSRWSAVLTMRLLPYVRMDESSKSKPVTKALTTHDFVIASAVALLALMLLPWGWQWAALGMLPPGAYLFHKLKYWLKGYTGDGLGAMQQVTEVGFYLAVIILL